VRRRVRLSACPPHVSSRETRRKTVALHLTDRSDRRFLSTTPSRRRDLAPIYSNRSASFLRLSKVSQALSDAERCIELRPDWDKAYFRKATALEAQNDDDAALVQFEVRQEPFFEPPEAPRSRRFSFRVLRFFR
jgi:tetratricopeptide (TPR) repeat protein